jgi:hypothetical protein
MLISGGKVGLQFGYDGLIRLAYRDGNGLGRFHHNAFHDGLTANIYTRTALILVHTYRFLSARWKNHNHAISVFRRIRLRFLPQVRLQIWPVCKYQKERRFQALF